MLIGCRFRVPHVEVIIGEALDSNADGENVLQLPEPLLSHYSPRMNETYETSKRENKRSTSIRLPTVKSPTFDLFVHWMYYGSYTPSVHTISEDHKVSQDIQAWMLGDHLQSVAFKNYTMRRVYGKHTGFGTSLLTLTDAAYVFDLSPIGSKICTFFTDFLTLYFSDPMRIQDGMQG